MKSFFLNVAFSPQCRHLRILSKTLILSHVELWSTVIPDGKVSSHCAHFNKRFLILHMLYCNIYNPFQLDSYISIFNYMNMKEKTIAIILIIILAIAIVLGATSPAGQYGFNSQQGFGSIMGGKRGNMMGYGMMGGYGGMMNGYGNGMMGGGYNKDSFSSNGERIYYTGIDSTGRRIGFEGGTMWLNMRGGSCVNCHGTKGKGGVPVMMGTEIPEDLTNLYAPHSHVDEKMVLYNDDLLERAITKGIDANGKSLGPTMPGWYMPEKDLNDLVTYIKTLQTEDQN